MKMTSKKIDTILARYRELKDYAEQAVGGYEVRFDDAGNIEQYVNTACHCHPEYEWQLAMTREKFEEWLKEKGY